MLELAKFPNMLNKLDGSGMWKQVREQRCYINFLMSWTTGWYKHTWKQVWEQLRRLNDPMFGMKILNCHMDHVLNSCLGLMLVFLEKCLLAKFRKSCQPFIKKNRKFYVKVSFKYDFRSTTIINAVFFLLDG